MLPAGRVSPPADAGLPSLTYAGGWVQVDTTGWAVSSPKDIPHQQNCSDCGVFMSVFANFVSRDAQYEFGQAHMPAIRRKFVTSIIEDTVA